MYYIHIYTHMYTHTHIIVSYVTISIFIIITIEHPLRHDYLRLQGVARDEAELTVLRLCATSYYGTMYVCMYICIYVYICMYITHTYIYIVVFICMYVFTYIVYPRSVNTSQMSQPLIHSSEKGEVLRRGVGTLQYLLTLGENSAR